MSSLLQLHAIRWDLQGQGFKGFEDPDRDINPPDISRAGALVAGTYGIAFPGPLANMGCPSSGCTGYELTTNLEFSSITDNDVWYDSATGWDPIVGYNAVFEYNTHTIRNGTADVNPFGQLGSDADVRNEPGGQGAGGAGGEEEPTPSPSSPIAGFTLLDGDDGAVI